jgi:probable phosphoglycerate mutase
MTELLIVRHGETDFNRQLRFQGQVDVPLNATGLEQAGRLARRLAGEPFEGLIASDLQRAWQTAEPLAASRAQPAARLPALREQAFGLVEGLTAPEIQARHPELWEGWLRHDPDFAMPGGESTRQFHARVVQAVRELAEANAGRRLVIVTHGGVLDMLWRTVHGLPLAGPRQCAIPNTGLNRLRWQGGTLDIVEWADAAHLEGLPPQPSTAQSSRPPAAR